MLICLIVVNCLQNVSLRYYSQWISYICCAICSCELLTKCIFAILFTIDKLFKSFDDVLWIAYKMYLCDIIHNFCLFIFTVRAVVNCLQNVSLRYYSQLSRSPRLFSFSCELLTKCIFAILFTIFLNFYSLFFSLWIAYKMYLCDIIHNLFGNGQTSVLLWIAYKMYLCDIIHNAALLQVKYPLVVNCLQNVSLRYYSQ